MGQNKKRISFFTDIESLRDLFAFLKLLPILNSYGICETFKILHYYYDLNSSADPQIFLESL